jgi:hypothetical protein
MDAFPHHIRPVLRGGEYYRARYFCEGMAVVVRGDVFCFQREEDAEKFRRRFGCVLAETFASGGHNKPRRNERITL